MDYLIIGLRSPLMGRRSSQKDRTALLCRILDCFLNWYFGVIKPPVSASWDGEHVIFEPSVRLVRSLLFRFLCRQWRPSQVIPSQCLRHID